MIQLKLNPKNPRRINDKEFERLKNKIKEFPDMLLKRPIVYDENGVILGGNMRYRALQQLENEGLEIKDGYFSNIADWTEEQKDYFIINDNLSDGDWDYDLLANEWSDLPLGDWGIYMAKEWDGEMQPKENNEINVDGLMDHNSVTCPRCQFMFNPQNV